MNVVLVTGGFDPVHSGHIAYFEAAKQLGDILVVGLNSDAWLERKKGKAFMDIHEREKIISSLRVVDKVVCYPDADGSSKNAITGVREMYPDATIIFANGGDRTAANIPEMDLKDNNLIFKFGIGGENKMNSSSWILNEWKAPKTERPWGYYRVLHEVPGTKVKELTVMPGQSLSMQQHQHRSEYWFVAEGSCQVVTELATMQLYAHDRIDIPVTQWHQLTNPFLLPCRLIEIQYGNQCDEADIERRSS
jgi:cytidyltransferase-like protein